MSPPHTKILSQKAKRNREGDSSEPPITVFGWYFNYYSQGAISCFFSCRRSQSWYKSHWCEYLLITCLWYLKWLDIWVPRHRLLHHHYSLDLFFLSGFHSERGNFAQKRTIRNHICAKHDFQGWFHAFSPKTSQLIQVNYSINVCFKPLLCRER